MGAQPVPQLARGPRWREVNVRAHSRRSQTDIHDRAEGEPRAGQLESGGVAIGERRLGMSAESVTRVSRGAVAVARAERGTASERLGALITAQASVMLDHPHLCAPWWATWTAPLTCPTWRLRSTPPFSPRSSSFSIRAWRTVRLGGSMIRHRRRQHIRSRHRDRAERHGRSAAAGVP